MDLSWEKDIMPFFETNNDFFRRRAIPWQKQHFFPITFKIIQMIPEQNFEKFLGIVLFAQEFFHFPGKFVSIVLLAQELSQKHAKFSCKIFYSIYIGIVFNYLVSFFNKNCKIGDELLFPPNYNVLIFVSIG
jgi:hypothetical protein